MRTNNNLGRVCILAISFLVVSIESLYSQEFITKTAKIGNMNITILVDGRSERTLSILTNTKGNNSLEKVPADFSMTTDLDICLVEYGNEKILFDTGNGVTRNARLVLALNSIKIKPADITAIILTHMHGDHIGGLVNNNKPVFENAILFVPEEEYKYWIDVAKNERAISIFNTLKEYNKKVQIFSSKSDTISRQFNKDGVSVVAENAFGHTPGHTIYKLKSAKEELIVWGDLLHVIDVQLKYPDISATFDMNREMAANTRKRVLEYVAKNKSITTGTHTESPGLFYIEKDGSGYKKVEVK